MAKQFLVSERDADRIEAMLRWYERNRAAKPFRRRQILAAGGAGSTLKLAYIAENPHNDATILINLVVNGVEQTEGDNAGIEATVIIANGTRLDFAVPWLSTGQPVIAQRVEGTWYVQPPFNAARDFTS